MMLYGLPGMDHAGIATQAKVDDKIKKYMVLIHRNIN